MPFLAPVVGAVVAGFTAAWAWAGSTVIGMGLRTLATQMLIGAGINLAMRKIIGKPKAGKVLTGEHQSVQTEPNTPRQVLVGQFATAGSYVFHTSYSIDGDNDHVKIVFALADHECEAFLGGWWNDRRMTINAETGAVAEARVDGKDHLWVKVHLGGWNQAADADLVAKASGRWTVNDRGRGVCYAVVTARYSEKAHPGGLNGLFQILWELKGAKLYDRRLDSTAGGAGTHRINDTATHAYSENAAVVLDNLLRGFRVEDTSDPDLNTRARDIFYGLDLTTADLPADEWIAATNACDEDAATKTGVEPRYRACGLIDCSQEPEAPLRDLLTAMAGEMLYGPGRWFPLPGVARTSERTITPDMMRIDVARRYRKSAPSGEAVNAVYGRFYDPAQFYRPIDLPPRLNAADELADRGRKADTLELSLVPSQTQGQRVMEINRRRHRQQQTTTFALKPDQLDLEGGDAVTITTEYYSFHGRLYSAAVKTDDRDFLTPVVEVKEESSDTYAWDPETDELDRPGVTSLTTTRPLGQPVEGLTVTPYAIADASGASRPGLAFGWDLVTDPAAFGVRVEWRVSGSSKVFTQDRAVDPDSAEQGLNVEAGVAGGDVYEARAAILYRPIRTPVFSDWTASALMTPAIIAGDVVPSSPTILTNLDLMLDVLLSRTEGVIAEEEQRLVAETDARDRFDVLGWVDTVTRQTELNGGDIRFTPGGLFLDDAEARVGSGLATNGDVARPLTVPITDSSNILRRTSGGIYTGDLAATLGAAWGTNLTGRPAELTDGRIVAALDSSGDLARPITSGNATASNLMRRSGGGLFTGDLGATLGASWGGNLTGRPTELTDGRITTALTSGGVLQTAIPSALADTSNILRRTAGGLFIGSLAATAGATWGVDVGSRPTELTDGRISAGLASNGDLARNLPSGILTGSNLITRAGGGGAFTGDLNATAGAAWATNLTGRPTELTDGRIASGLASNGDVARNLPSPILTGSNLVTRAGGGGAYTGDLNATAGATWGVNVGSIPTALTDGRVAAGLDSSGDLTRPIPTGIANSSGLLRRSGGGLFIGALNATDDTAVDALSTGLASGSVKPAEAVTFTGRGALADKNTANTADLVTNAVTSEGVAFTAAEVNIITVGTSRVNVQTITRTVTGLPVTINANFYLWAHHGDDDWDLRIFVERLVGSTTTDVYDSGDLRCIATNGDGFIVGWQPLQFTDEPPAGSVTYAVRVVTDRGSNFNKFAYRSRFLAVREFKR